MTTYCDATKSIGNTRSPLSPPPARVITRWTALRTALLLGSALPMAGLMAAGIAALFFG